MSLWLIFNAWDRHVSVTDDDLEDAAELDDVSYFDQSAAIELERQKWFRPDTDSSWAHFPGLTRRTLMAKLADNVHTWHFEHLAELRMNPVWTGEDAVPAFVCAHLTSDGYVVRPRIDREYACLS